MCKFCKSENFYWIGDARYCRLCHLYVEPVPESDRARNAAVAIICLVGIVTIFLFVLLDPILNP